MSEAIAYQRGVGGAATYRKGETNYCPGCGRTHWYVRGSTAECAFCTTALPLQHAKIGGSTHA
jgi:hypothetical protein